MIQKKPIVNIHGSAMFKYTPRCRYPNNPETATSRCRGGTHKQERERRKMRKRKRRDGKKEIYISETYLSVTMSNPSAPAATVDEIVALVPMGSMSP